jgi:hypothetical protein
MRKLPLLGTLLVLCSITTQARAAEPVKAVDRFPSHLDSPPALDLGSAALIAPRSETFALHSCPGATKVIYLDFDGHLGFEGDYAPFNFEGAPDTFSDAELATIQLAWRSVSEDFLPFEVDVTTEDPGVEALRNTGGGDTEWGIRCVISASNWDYSWAYIGSFNWDTDYESQIYPGDNSWLWIADSASHEAGHALWLQHDGGGGDGEYYEGHGSGLTYWAPIMGWTADIGVSQWSQGEYDGADNDEDDLLIITTQNGFGYRADDHGSTIGTATPISLGAGEFLLAAEGIIERRDDLDYFAFTLSEAGEVRFRIEPDSLSANLDVLAKLRDAGGMVLSTSNPEDSLHADLHLFLDAGDYTLSVEGTGFGNPPADGYSDYGSLGYFTIETMGSNPTNVAGSEAADSGFRFSRRPTSPFSARTEFSFAIPMRAKVQARVFDVRGRLVDTLFEEELTAGTHRAVWVPDSRRLPATGLYFIRVDTGTEQITAKAIYLP